ncbi:hypothetical protein ACHAQH_005413 [Verticillium albo-atrum]
MSAPDSGNLSPPDPKRRRTKKPVKPNVKAEPDSNDFDSNNFDFNTFDFTEPYNMDINTIKKRLEEINAKFAAGRERLMADYKAQQLKLAENLLTALENQLNVQANSDVQSIHALAEATQRRIDAESRITEHINRMQSSLERLETLLSVVLKGRVEEAEAALLHAGVIFEMAADRAKGE